MLTKEIIEKAIEASKKKSEPPSTVELAFKIPSEPGWRVTSIIQGAAVEDRSGAFCYHFSVHKIGHWGAINSAGGGGLQFCPLDENGQLFANVRRIVSPADTRSDAELLAEIKAAVEASASQ